MNKCGGSGSRLEQFALILNPLDNGGFILALKLTRKRPAQPFGDSGEPIIDGEPIGVFRAVTVMASMRRDSGELEEKLLHLYARDIHEVLAIVEEGMLGRAGGLNVWERG